MTSTNVTQAAGMFLGASGIVAAGGASHSMDDGFSQIMSRTSHDGGNKMSEKDQSTAVKAPVKVERSNLRKTDGNVKEAEASEKTRKDLADDAKEVSEKGKAQKDVSGEGAGKDEAASEAVAEAVDEIKQAISETLGISEEETEELIAQLGLTNADLLIPDTMRQIVMAAAGESDQMSILTNEALYMEMQQLTETAETIVSDLQSQLSADDAGFAQMLAQMEQLPETEMTAEAIPETMPVAEETQAAIVSEEQAPEEMQETATVSQNEVSKEQEATETSLPENNGEDGKQSSEIKAERRQNASEEQNAGSKQEGGSHFMQDIFKSAAEAWNDNVAEVRPSYQEQAADTQRIMDQITEYMKVEVKPETTELELRLHPETLGTVHIHLSAKEGVVTAQFAAENEAVKAVLEAQAVQLRENLDQQGVKVEAVEVTVASHAFNRSFAENGDSNSHYEEPKKKGIRRIQLTDDVPLEEMELSDEERIAAEMMEQNGNTVDYTA